MSVLRFANVWSENKQIYYISIVHPLEVVGGGNETQLQVGTNVFFTPAGIVFIRQNLTPALNELKYF